jgi:hypothetical protein
MNPSTLSRTHDSASTAIDKIASVATPMRITVPVREMAPLAVMNMIATMPAAPNIVPEKTFALAPQMRYTAART